MSKNQKIAIISVLSSLPIIILVLLAVITQETSWLYDQLFIIGWIYLVIGLLLFLRYNSIQRKHTFGRTTDEYYRKRWRIELNPKYEEQFEPGYKKSRKHWLMIPFLVTGISYIIISFICLYTLYY